MTVVVVFQFDSIAWDGLSIGRCLVSLPCLVMCVAAAAASYYYFTNKPMMARFRIDDGAVFQ